MLSQNLYNFSKRVQQSIFFNIMHKQIVYAEGDAEGEGKKETRGTITMFPPPTPSSCSETIILRELVFRPTRRNTLIHGLHVYRLMFCKILVI